MEQAGPSSLARHSRIADSTSPSEASSKSMANGSPGPSPLLRNTTHTPEQGSRHIRRRTNSDALQGSELGNLKALQNLNRASTKAGKRPAHPLDVVGPGLDAFSDEYDLAHEDPGVMEDVQRALKMKARREARLGGLYFNSPGKDSSKFSELSPRSSFSMGSPPTTPSRMSTGITFPTSGGLSAGESEVDFRPSVSAAINHPVPRSVDDGATLDWSGDKSSDEKFDRRWSLSITRRKPKERPIGTADKHVAENQGHAYDEKLARIKARAKLLTLRKAAMTTAQLQRRYALLGPFMKDSSIPVNLAAIVRWHTSQESTVRASLERSEPSTWLKHLERKPGKSARSSWNVTALIVEEYMRAQFGKESMQTIPENSALASPEGVSSKVDLGPSRSSPKVRDPQIMKRLSHNSPNALELPPEHGVNVRRSESSTRAWKHLTQSDKDSQKSSSYSVLNWSRSQAASPNSSRFHVRDFAHRRKSDEVSSRNSLSEGYSQPEDSVPSRSKQNGYLSNPELHSSIEPGLDVDPISSRSIPGATAASWNFKDIPTAGLESQFNLETNALGDRPSIGRHDNTRSTKLLHVRRSLPSSDRLLNREEKKRQKQTDEENERREYEIRAQLLESVMNQNYRIRQVLQRLTAEIKEFDSVQSSLSGLLGVPGFNIPRDVLDAFSHDPAAVTGPTRRLKGWRAVEDIYARITWQREVLQNFVTSIVDLRGKDFIPTGIFDESIAGLMESVAQLEQHRDVIVENADEVTYLLTSVRDTHGVVKAKFNDALAHTSQIYPEIFQISSLEESYRDRYQHFWAFGMDALTFFLDSVTPFWRTYGKTIGVDVQDFLIIPWYRNEFTGEQKRYRIKHLPKRSYRHWVGLFLLPIITFGIMILQARAAILSFTWILKSLFLRNPGLSTIFLPLLVTGVIIQWAAVLVELSIIFAEVGVVIWWIGWSVGAYT